MEKAMTLRLSPNLHDQASAVAESLGLTLSAYIRLALTEHSRAKLKAAPVPSRQLAARQPAGAVASERTEEHAHGDKRAAVAPPSKLPQSLNSPCACRSGLKFKRCCGKAFV